MKTRRIAAVCFFCLLCAACSPRNRPDARAELLLGTVCSITLYDKAPGGLVSRAFGRVREIEERMSVNLPDSDISRANAAAGVSPVSAAPETLALVREGLRFSRSSGGAFNIAIGPLVSLWGIGTERAAVPAQADIVRALRHIDFTRVNADTENGTLFLRDTGMALDLGAIAKGYAADEAARILREAGVPRALIDFGGNIFVIGSRPDGSPWRVGVQNPAAERGQFLGIIEARDTAVVSSGVYERFFTGPDGERYHHILDTATGRPARSGLLQVTVVSPSSRDADAFSTTLFALGLEAGMKLAEKTEGVEALFITEDKKLHATRGMKNIFRLTDTSFRLE